MSGLNAVLTVTRWLKCFILSADSRSFNSVCPTRTIWSNFSRSVSRFDRRRSSSRVSSERSWASSTIMITSLPREAEESRKSLKALSISFLFLPFMGTFKSSRTAMINSSGVSLGVSTSAISALSCHSSMNTFRIVVLPVPGSPVARKKPSFCVTA